ncbi:methylated-DNA--[protein]-cysteine S-methyltransferase [candidate division KSB1 bacterium]|nr:methylated-DNA--[protein]-cysteine S-methyltransferase [candidate division KSB1 bacterium]RQW06095.1 MAG: methylated-DNA--[protein]-cysteine S-methyltransferase [candidate division KSB1 bacterium]
MKRQFVSQIMNDKRTIYVTSFPWDVTCLWLAASNQGLSVIEFERKQSFDSFKERFNGRLFEQMNDILYKVVEQLDNYFRGQPEAFNIPLDFLAGTTFQKAVWHQVRAIPYGRTKTYGQIANELGQSRAVRAVGVANGANPLPVVVPCHRVIRTNGSLGGYSGGLDIKDALLRLEGVVL